MRRDTVDAENDCIKHQGSALVFFYLTSHPFSFTALFTLSILLLASSSISVRSNDWKTSRNAYDTFPFFSNWSNSSLRTSKSPACLRKTLNISSGRVPLGTHIAISRTINGYFENG